MNPEITGILHERDDVTPCLMHENRYQVKKFPIQFDDLKVEEWKGKVAGNPD